MPSLRKGEKQADFVSRCIREVMHEGVEQKQAIARCYSMYKQQKKRQRAKQSRRRP